MAGLVLALGGAVSANAGEGPLLVPRGARVTVTWQAASGNPDGYLVSRESCRRYAAERRTGTSWSTTKIPLGQYHRWYVAAIRDEPRQIVAQPEPTPWVEVKP